MKMKSLLHIYIAIAGFFGFLFESNPLVFNSQVIVVDAGTDKRSSPVSF